ncbi:GNAT family acetyltransferase [Natrialba magadii ATCC 43099]|uniref:GNAT family acetyltransferase n=1 Tax=Natrialba magadii (strain ATCC 43099 / DSM 3394 / CCM 3739 / CIP 104546 / IAM 13178 / JCM 8861 / NBRC 102185 / NCIMB 2190 / MS3) TaxID=547559 RepID=D3SSS7_NATMM|nr:GNAT family N-acetyltransferase [Natrialba magadii]ADD04873.1 GNAT family acetyltransferase [Natrialba magadii ATCC 43099]ELY24458.1 N-acetyltransferase GCN5 [Natrialba magadii ATCC 43099]
MDWTIRQAPPSAAATIREIARESWHAAYDDFLGTSQVDRMIDDWYELEALESSIATAADQARASFLVAVPSEVDDAANGEHAENAENATAAVGFAHAGVDPDEPETAYLPRLYARPSVWGEGVGTALIDRVEADLRSHSDRLRLTVLADNEVGVSFYESRGFERVETRPSDLESVDGEGVLEEHIYEKSL